MINGRKSSLKPIDEEENRPTRKNSNAQEESKWKTDLVKVVRKGGESLLER